MLVALFIDPVNYAIKSPFHFISSVHKGNIGFSKLTEMPIVNTMWRIDKKKVIFNQNEEFKNSMVQQAIK